jgi:hypothetical protein
MLLDLISEYLLHAPKEDAANQKLISNVYANIAFILSFDTVSCSRMGFVLIINSL